MTAMIKSNNIRRKFNPTSKVDIEVYRKFLKSGKWTGTGCPFVLEYPFVNIPIMIDNKLVRRFLKL